MELHLGAGKSKRGKLGWDLKKGERLRHDEQRDWAWKMVWVREVDQGVRLGLGLWRQRLCLGDGVISPSWPPVWHSFCIALYALFLFTVSGTHREQFS